jgi:hypothetical protein
VAGRGFAAACLLLILAGCGSSNQKLFETGKFSLHYPEAWTISDTTDNSTFLANQPLDLQKALLGDGLNTGQASIFVLWSDHEAWSEGLSSTEIRSRLLESYEGEGARWGYRVDMAQAHDETVGGKVVSIAPIIREYQMDMNSSKIQNEGWVLATDFGDGFSVRLTCLADKGEFASLEAVCRQVAESLHYKS